MSLLTPHFFPFLCFTLFHFLCVSIVHFLIFHSWSYREVCCYVACLCVCEIMVKWGGLGVRLDVKRSESRPLFLESIWYPFQRGEQGWVKECDESRCCWVTKVNTVRVIRHKRQHSWTSAFRIQTWVFKLTLNVKTNTHSKKPHQKIPWVSWT